MAAGINMLVLNLVYGAAASTRVPLRYSLRLVNRKPPLEISSQATTTSSPEYRMQATAFIPARLFLRRSSRGDAAAPGFGFRLGSAPPGLFSVISRLVSLQAMNELQIPQERLSSFRAWKISNSISDSESAHTVWQPLHSRWTVFGDSAAGNWMCHGLTVGSRKTSP